jgi:hypothetical protein
MTRRIGLNELQMGAIPKSWYFGECNSALVKRLKQLIVLLVAR